jgi:hypothetical protein
MRIMAALAVSVMATTPAKADMGWLPKPAMELLHEYPKQHCPSEYEALKSAHDLFASDNLSDGMWAETNDNTLVNNAAKVFFMFRPVPKEARIASAWVNVTGDHMAYWATMMEQAKALAEHENYKVDPDQMGDFEEALGAFEASIALLKCMDVSDDILKTADQQFADLAWHKRDGDQIMTAKRMMDCTHWNEAMDAILSAYRETSDPKALHANMYAAFKATFVPCDKEKLQ